MKSENPLVISILCITKGGNASNVKPNRAAQQKAKAKAAAMGTAQQAMDPALEACKDGDIKALRSFLDDGSFDPATKLDRFGGSGLHWAAGAGHFEVGNPKGAP